MDFGGNRNRMVVHLSCKEFDRLKDKGGLELLIIDVEQSVFT